MNIQEIMKNKKRKKDWARTCPWNERFVPEELYHKWSQRKGKIRSSGDNNCIRFNGHTNCELCKDGQVKFILLTKEDREFHKV